MRRDEESDRRLSPRWSMRDRWLWLVAIMVVSAALATGCGDDEDGSDGEAGGGGQGQGVSVVQGGTGRPEQMQVSVGIFPTVTAAPLALAIEEGFFEEEGLTVETKITSGPGTGPALLGGDIDLGTLTWIEWFVATERDVPLRPLAAGSVAEPGLAEFLVRADSSVKTVDDLVNKKVAVISSPGVCDVNALDTLRSDGVEGRPEFIVLPIPDMPGALARGDVDAACAPEPLLSAMKADKAFRSIFDVFAGPYDQQPIAGYFSTSEYAEQNPKTIGAFQRGLKKAVRMIAEDPGVVAEIVPTFTEITREQAARMTQGAFPGEIDLAGLQELGGVLERVEIVDSAVEIAGGGSQE